MAEAIRAAGAARVASSLYVSPTFVMNVYHQGDSALQELLSVMSKPCVVITVAN